ncbi:ATP-binding protein [Holophaga foetida]|uniref:ATP-binding protein n=1 Tax=Holophaga foetida TaxID=35839 RepID=UPI000247532A|nr:ATP-binding protein [Holophaga foetida]
MDGVKKRLRYSLRLRLSLWLSLAIGGLAIAGGLLSLRAAWKEVHELQDDVLRQVAILVRYQPASAISLGEGPTGAKGVDRDDSITILPLPHRGAQEGLASVARLRDGLYTVPIGGRSFRVALRSLPGGGRIAVTQATKARDQIALSGALHTVLPMALLLPVIILMATHVVRRMFKPVASLAAEVEARGDRDLHPLPQRNLPLEVDPFVTAINRLLTRVSQSMETQQRFIADAAHELRTPLTALSLQAQRVEAAEMSPEARERLEVMREGLERNRRLLDQLLGLASAQRSTTGAGAEVTLREVFHRVLEDVLPLAEAKGMDVGIAGEADVRLAASEADLVSLVRNLVDNAVRYTPEGGRVDLGASESGDQVILQIEDNGPGIPVEERERVLDPFYRVLGSEQPGSGLGLSIVRTLAERLGGRLELADSTRFDHGLKVTVTFSKV